jgi:large subunit ribosomal protein L15
MRLNQISDKPEATRPRKRVGRGIGSGSGKTSGKGHKGQKARSGGQRFVGFEGGQMPLYRRLPKRGFKNPFRREYVVINIGALQRAVERGRLDASQPIDEAAMRTAGLFSRRRDGVRLLAKGELTMPLHIRVTGASKSAIVAIEKAGGSLSLAAGGGPLPAPNSKSAPA